MNKIVAFSGVYGSGKSTTLAAVATAIGARVVTLPSRRVVHPPLPDWAPARHCLAEALTRGPVLGRLALVTDCCREVEVARHFASMPTVFSCSALDTAAHQGVSLAGMAAVIEMCGDVRPDLVIWLNASVRVVTERLTARDGKAPSEEEVTGLKVAYANAVMSARARGWNVAKVYTNRPVDGVVAQCLNLINGG